jgi:hypothetical protein
MTAILSLFTPSRPAAITGGVGSIIVGAVKAMIRRRPASHVGEKIRIVLPTSGNRNSSSAVSWKIFAARIIATAAHRRPSFPFWRFPIAVTSVFAANSQVFLTAAGLNSSRLKVASLNDVVATANATTKPIRDAFFNASQGNDSQKIELPAGQVNKSVLALFSTYFFSEASTRSRPPGFKSPSADDRFGPAFTQAVPIRDLSPKGETDDCQSGELLSCKIDESRVHPLSLPSGGWDVK